MATRPHPDRPPGRRPARPQVAHLAGRTTTVPDGRRANRRGHDFPPVCDADRSPGTTALLDAMPAYRSAVAAAAAHAAASAACRAIDTEVADTARRLRAINDRWLPALEEQLHELSQRLEEAERAETARLRWVARRRGGAGDAA